MKGTENLSHGLCTERRLTTADLVEELKGPQGYGNRRLMWRAANETDA